MKFKEDGDLTLSSTNAEVFTNSDKLAYEIIITASVSNSSLIKVGDSTPSISLNAGDFVKFENIRLNTLFAKGQIGDSVEWIINAES